jgi:hypothetical protein
MKQKLILVLPLVFVVLACSSTSPGDFETTVTPLPSSPYWTPTMNIQEFSGTLIANEQNNALTKQANELLAEQERVNAEQAAIKATQEANRLNATSTAGAATTIAYNALQTASVAETATARAEATRAVETSIAGRATAAQMPTSAIWTAEAVEREARIQEAEVQNVEMARDRQQTKNFADAVLPWALTVIALFLIGRGLFEYLKNRVLTRDEHGKMPTVMRQLPDGSMVITRLDLLPAPTAVIRPDGGIIIAETSEEQADVTRRTQITEAISALPIPYARNAPALMKTEFGNGSSAPSVKIIHDARALSPVLEEAEAGLIEE